MTMSTSLSGIEGLKGKLAIVTGATGAIGSAIVKYLADDGLDIALLDLDQAKLEAAAAAVSHSSSITSRG